MLVYKYILNALETGILYESNSTKGKLTISPRPDNAPCLSSPPPPPPPPKKEKAKGLHDNHCLRFLLRSVICRRNKPF